MIRRILLAVLPVYEGEGARLTLFTALAFLIQAALAITVASSDALFLSMVGAVELPWVYLTIPLAMLLIAPFTSLLFERVGAFGVLLLASGALVVTTIGAVFAVLTFSDLAPTHVEAVIFALKVVASVFFILMYTIYWNFTDAFFDSREAKRLFPLCSGGAALGAAAGGAAVAIIGPTFGMAALFSLAALLAIACVPLALVIKRQCTAIDLGLAAMGSQEHWMKRLAEWSSTFRSSPFARVLTASIFCTMVVTLFVEYLYMSELGRERNEAELTHLFGVLFFSASVLNFIITVGVLPWVVRRYGVGTVAFTQPFVFTLTLALFAFDYPEIGAIAGFFACHAILSVVDYNITNLLLNGLPGRLKKQLRTIIEGLCEPVATAVAGAVLAVVATALVAGELASLGLIAVVAMWWLVWRVRDEYPGALRTNVGVISQVAPEEKQSLDLFSEGPSDRLDEVSRRLDYIDEYPFPPSRHTIESLTALGVQVVPELLSEARRNDGGAARQFAALSAAYALSPEPTSLLLSDVLEASAERAERYRRINLVISRDGSGSVAHAALRTYLTRHYVTELRFCVGILELEGRIQDGQQLVTLLGSPHRKVRADSAEAIEQCAPLRVRWHLMRALLDESECPNDGDCDTALAELCDEKRPVTRWLAGVELLQHARGSILSTLLEELTADSVPWVSEELLIAGHHVYAQDEAKPPSRLTAWECLVAACSEPYVAKEELLTWIPRSSLLRGAAPEAIAHSSEGMWVLVKGKVLYGRSEHDAQIYTAPWTPGFRREEQDGPGRIYSTSAESVICVIPCSVVSNRTSSLSRHYATGSVPG